MHTFLLGVHLEDEAAIETTNAADMALLHLLLLMLKTLLQIFGLVKHDPRIVRKTPLLLIRRLADVVVRIAAACPTRCGGYRTVRSTIVGGASPTVDAEALVAAIPPCPRLVVLAEDLGDMLASDWPNRTATLLPQRRLLALVLRRCVLL
mmetsp:Transcript_46917/g.62087  ORF Transcript_46917/g.62087 Transcript_46917/m.62087 type:complete len:150 (-) Transcript_46917:2636-3085(-)